MSDDIVERLKLEMSWSGDVTIEIQRGTCDALLAEIESLRTQVIEITKQRDHHASTIFINSVQMDRLKAQVSELEAAIAELHRVP